MPAPAHVFISYARKDSDFVDRLDSDLQTRGIVTWRDQHSIPGGEDWYDNIIVGLKASYAVVNIVTEASFGSKWVKKECLYADYLNIEVILAFPLPYHIPLYAINVNPIEFHHGYDEALVRLIATLTKLKAAHAASTPAPLAAPSTTPTRSPKEQAYLDFILSEVTEADKFDALYVKLAATQENPISQLETANKRSYRGRAPKFGRLGIETVQGNDFDKPGDPITDAREPIKTLQRVVLLGDPGAGKTTTLLQLASDYAHGAYTDPSAKLPVFVPLREFNGADGQPFEAFVQAQMGTLQSQFADLTRAGRLLLLCDALNEMPRTAADGRDLVREVRDYLRDKPDWVVSCRVRDYQEALAAIPQVGKIRLKPLTSPQIHEFITKRFEDDPDTGAKLWGEMYGTGDLLTFWEYFEQAGQTEAFWKADNLPKSVVAAANQKYEWKVTGYYHRREMLQDRRRMMLLCRNPYMTNLVCELYASTGKLPDNRGQLFADVVDNLLAREEETCLATGTAWLDQTIIRAGLARIAWAMGKETEMSRADAEKLLVNIPIPTERVPQSLPQNAPKSTALGEGTSDSPSNSTRLEEGTLLPSLSTSSSGAFGEGAGVGTDSALFFRLAAAASLIDVGDSIRFTHQLLQEYFASIVLEQIIATQPATTLWTPDAWWKPNGREETIIILAGVRGTADGVQAVAEWLAPAQPELAVEVLTQSGVELPLDQITDATKAALIDSARAKIQSTNIIEQARGYRVLGRLQADERPGIGVVPIPKSLPLFFGEGTSSAAAGLPSLSTSPIGAFGEGSGMGIDILWCPIPAGEFMYGDAKTPTPMPYAYAISQYPVTNAQYQPFIDAGGYTQREWWTEVGWDWRESANRTTPNDYGYPFTLPNHPRVGVTWYECVAYSHWLTAQTAPDVWRSIKNRLEEIDPTQIKGMIRLPSEHEWEKAARGTDGRVYPWGDGWDATKCNNSELGIGSTSAVGMFPQGASPYGAEEMSGNVWEWCLTEHDVLNNKYILKNNYRVLRGGSFGVAANNLRAADRGRNFPGNVGLNIGDRCACSF